MGSEMCIRDSPQSVLLVTTLWSVTNAIKNFEGKSGARTGGVEGSEKHNGHAKEAWRARHDRLVTRRLSLAKILTTSFLLFWINAVTSLRKRDMRHTETTRGTRTSFYKHFLPNARECEPPATRGDTLGWTATGTWYTLCTSMSLRVL